jgi:hypothetical protein
MLLASHGCRFGTLTPALLHLLAVVEEYARFHDLVVVAISATDSDHAHDAYDAHARGEALDVRCTDPAGAGAQAQLLTSLLDRLGPEFVGKVGTRFRGGPHIHLQLRQGARFHAPPVPTHAARFDAR